MFESYKCCSCSHEFQAPAGPVQCPSCGHAYVQWLSYDYNFKNCDGERVQEVVAMCPNGRGHTHYARVRHGHNPIMILHREFKSEEEARTAIPEMRIKLGLATDSILYPKLGQTELQSVKGRK